MGIEHEEEEKEKGKAKTHPCRDNLPARRLRCRLVVVRS